MQYKFENCFIVRFKFIHSGCIANVPQIINRIFSKARFTQILATKTLMIHKNTWNASQHHLIFDFYERFHVFNNGHVFKS